jgi:uncharacterized protein (TIGR00299 family) protein
MMLGSLVDAGADRKAVLRTLERLPVGGWSLDFEPAMRNGLACTRAVVEVAGDSVVRTFMHILGVLEEARLPDRVRERAISAFSALAEAEGRVHRRSPSEVRFHEVGGHDTIVDIVGSAAALEDLRVDAVTSSPVATGVGGLESAHGWMPVPAPAVVELLHGVPLVGRAVPHELTTPTGAAMLRAWAGSFGAVPDMTVERSGFGAGTRELEGFPNCLQVVVGEEQPAEEGLAEPLVALETNVDDVTGETLAHAIDALLAAGALDAWVVSTVTKKGRPGHVLSALCRPGETTVLLELMRSSTGTLGVRMNRLHRWSSTRNVAEVAVDGVPVRVKVSSGRVKAEHDDVARAAERLGLPLIEVAARAEAAYRLGGHSGTNTEAPVTD